MKAATFGGPSRIEVKDVPEPSIQQPTDVILRVTCAAICGSDIHAFSGKVPSVKGWTLGHEYVGEVLEVGPAVTGLQTGDRVIGAPYAACGDCFFCRRRWPSQCSQVAHFGFAPLAGAQAEYLRVPFGQFNLAKVPDGVTDEQALFVSDILPTGYFAAEWGGVQHGDVVVVVGSGPVGLCAQMSAQMFQPAAVIAVDGVAERLEMARRIGSIAVDMNGDDPGKAIRERTEGRGADVVLEAVGDREAMRSCFRYVRPAGTISAVGVFSEAEFAFPMFMAYLRDITFRIGACPVQNYMSMLLEKIERAEIDPSVLVTHTLPLEEAAAGYDMFAGRRDGCVKVLLKP